MFQYKTLMKGIAKIALVAGMTVIPFLVSSSVFAWTEPTTSPPGGNVPAPINTGDEIQVKKGVLKIFGESLSWKGIVFGIDQFDNKLKLTMSTENLIWGAVSNNTTLGNLLLLQKGGTDELKLDVNGNLYIAGNVGIGDSSPAASLTVGDGDKFQVSYEGNLIKINNVSYSWPSSQGSSGTFLKNNGNGSLSWANTGGIDGGGAINQIAFFTGGTSITSDDRLYWNASADTLGIGTKALSLYPLQVRKEIDSTANGQLFDIINIFGEEKTGQGLWSGVGTGITFSLADKDQTETKLAGIYAVDEGNGLTVRSAGLALYTADDNTLAERVRIDSTGNVGIGTTGPGEKLHIDGVDKEGRIKITGKDWSGLIIENKGTNGRTISYENNASAQAALRIWDQTLGVTSNPLLEVKYDGKIGIGTTGPGEKLHIDGVDKEGRIKITGKDWSGLIIENKGTNGRTISYENNASAQAALRIWDQTLGVTSNPLLEVKYDGKIGIGTPNPDRKLHIVQGGAGVNENVYFLRMSRSGDPSIANVAWDFYGKPSNSNTLVLTSYRSGIQQKDIMSWENNDGRVGIMTNSPSQTLDVAGGIKIGGASASSLTAGTIQWNGYNFQGYKGSTWVDLDNQSVNYAAGNGLTLSGVQFKLGGALSENTVITQGGYKMTFNLTGTGDFDIQDNGISAFFVKDDGNVGIGETSPGAKLSVSGGLAVGSSYDTTSVSDGNVIISGNVGIGTNSPDSNAKLHVAGKLRIDMDDEVVLVGKSDGTTVNRYLIPSGMIAMFETLCPTGWTRFSQLDDKFPFGSDVHGEIGGQSSVTLMGIDVGNVCQDGCDKAVPDGFSFSIMPPYLKVIWCEKD